MEHEMSGRVFEVRAIPVWHIVIFAVLCFYMAVGVFAVARSIIEWPLILAFFIFPGSLFFMFLLSILFGKLKIYKDGISFRMYHVYFDEIDGIQLKWGGKLLVLGRMNWYLLLNPEEFIKAIETLKPEALAEYKKPIRKWKPLFYPIITLVSLLVLSVIGRVLGWMGVHVDPFAWAFVWGATTTISTIIWVYWLPHRYRIFGLGKLGTAVTIGLGAGIPVFLIMLTRLFM